MFSSAWIRMAAALAVIAIPGGAARPAEPGTVAAHDTFILDEYNIDVAGAADSSRIAAGLSFGTAYPNGWWWTAGPRVSFVRWSVDVPQQYGFGAGGAFGVGWRPERTVSPYASVALDRDFNVGGLFDWQTQIAIGARVNVTPDPREHVTMTFAIFQANVIGGDGPHGGDFGIAVLYSAVLFAKHRE
jgi:hypothetical protein